MSLEFLEIARAKARTEEERRSLDEIEARLRDVYRAEDDFPVRLAERRAARGEKGPRLSRARRQEIDEMTQDARRLEPALCRALAAEDTTAACIVAPLGSGLTRSSMDEAILAGLQAEDRPLYEAVLSARDALRAAILAFAGPDPELDALAEPPRPEARRKPPG